MTVDLSPLLSSLVQVGALALMALGGVAIQRLSTKLGLDAHAALTKQLDDALNKSIAAGAMDATSLIKARGWDHPDVKSAVLASAAAYLMAMWPGLLKSAGIDLGNPAYAQAKIAALLTRAFPAAMTPIAASPATPPAPSAAAA